MFYSRNTNVKIIKLHKRASRLVYDELLEKDNSLTLHHYNIQTLCIELCKVFSGQSQTISSDLFDRKNINYNLFSQPDFINPQI